MATYVEYVRIIMVDQVTMDESIASDGVELVTENPYQRPILSTERISSREESLVKMAL